MIQIVKSLVTSGINFSKSHKKLFVGCILLAMFTGIVVSITCYLVISPYKKFITTVQDTEQTHVGIVLGAGISKNGKPYKELEARLDVAAEAIKQGKIDKLILSGDNRFQNYNEPQAMKDYLVNSKNIPAEKLQPDFAGRSTYESCERAAKIFGVKSAVIFSAGSHLPRAIYLCRHFGIKAIGISSGVEANNSTRRELLARVKAVYNVILVGEPTVLGDPISID